MNTISTSQRPPTQELRDKYTELHSLIDAMGKTLLEMMRHPDTTAEMIDEARLKYFIAYATWIEARVALRKRYPEDTTRMLQRELPWNTKE